MSAEKRPRRPVGKAAERPYLRLVRSEEGAAFHALLLLCEELGAYWAREDLACEHWAEYVSGW